MKESRNTIANKTTIKISKKSVEVEKMKSDFKKLIDKVSIMRYDLVERKNKITFSLLTTVKNVSVEMKVVYLIRKPEGCETKNLCVTFHWNQKLVNDIPTGLTYWQQHYLENYLIACARAELKVIMKKK